MGATRELARFVAETSLEDIPEEAIRVAKGAFLDCLGVAVAGSVQPVGRIIIKHIKEMGGEPESGVIGGAFRTSVPNAALTNGTLSHALDYDDVGGSVGHPSCTLVGPILAIGDKLHKSGREALEAYILGYEVQGRITIGSHYSQSGKGLHRTALIGNMGATAAAAKLLKLNTKQIIMAFGIAGSGPGGLLSNAGTMTKPFHAGLACRTGIEAAMLAKDGFTSLANVLEAPDGFCDVYSGKGKLNEEEITKDLGSPLHIIDPKVGLQIKPYPCCGLMPFFLDAVLALIKEHHIPYEAIESVEVNISPKIDPSFSLPEVETGLQGKFNITYCVAVAILDGKVVLESFTDEKARDPRTKEAMRKVKLIPRPDLPLWAGVEFQETLSMGYPVNIKLKDGREYSHRVDIPKGTYPHTPLPEWEELIQDKYRDCVRPVLSTQKVERSIELMLNLEKLEDIKEVVDMVIGEND